MKRIAVWVVAALMTGSGCQRSGNAGKDAPDNADALGHARRARERSAC